MPSAILVSGSHSLQLIIQNISILPPNLILAIETFRIGNADLIQALHQYQWFGFSIRV